MQRTTMAALTALVLAGCSRTAPDESEKQAIAAIQELGGKFSQDATMPGQPVLMVNLSNTEVTDAGLAPVKDLKQLRTLFLDNTKIGDEGVAHFKGLKQLQVLSLVNTRVTDAGLAQIRELKLLQIVNLSNTRVSEGAIREFKKNVPTAAISK